MSERATPIDGVIFDLGNVVVDWNPRHLYRSPCKKLERPATSATGAPRAAIRRKLPPASQPCYSKQAMSERQDAVTLSPYL
jgi:hypothetical protein